MLLLSGNIAAEMQKIISQTITFFRTHSFLILFLKSRLKFDNKYKPAMANPIEIAISKIYCRIDGCGMGAKVIKLFV